MRNIVENLKAWIQRSNETMIELIVGILAVNICVVIPGGIISGNVLKFCLGELLGMFYAIFMVIHMTRTIEDMLEMPADESVSYARRGYAIRLVVTIIVIIAGLEIPYLGFAGLFIGMISIKISVWIRPLTRKFTTKYLSKGR